MQFQSSRLKIKRANKHIADIEARTARLPEAYIARVHKNPKFGNEVIEHVFRDGTIATDLALLIGDAVHNAKCALDYAWIGVLEHLVPSAVSKFAKFPVYPSRDELENALRSRKIDLSTPSLFNLILSKIQPYEGGNYAIWPIHKLDIMDKHRLLIPVLNVASVDGIKVENERGETERGFTWATTQPGHLFIPIEAGWHVKDKGKVAVEVVFNEGTPAHGLEVVETLNCYSRLILKVIELLEKL